MTEPVTHYTAAYQTGYEDGKGWNRARIEQEIQVSEDDVLFSVRALSRAQGYLGGLRNALIEADD